MTNILSIFLSGIISFSAITSTTTDTSIINSSLPLENIAVMSTEKFGWGFARNNTNIPPEIGAKYENMLKENASYYVGDTKSKVIYLTFDNGYENGFTKEILNILKKNKVPACFFATTPYIKENPQLIKRMDKEGHIVANHSTTHPSMPTVTDKRKFEEELKICANAYKEITGNKMKKYFRPPMGEFSETSLNYTKEFGYKSIFWSFAYHDWDTNNQPSHEEGLKMIKDNIHNGEIMLLHSVSKTNTEILDEAIKNLKNQGYTFKSLDELPKHD